MNNSNCGILKTADAHKISETLSSYSFGRSLGDYETSIIKEVLSVFNIHIRDVHLILVILSELGFGIHNHKDFTDYIDKLKSNYPLNIRYKDIVSFYTFFSMLTCGQYSAYEILSYLSLQPEISMKNFNLLIHDVHEILLPRYNKLIHKCKNGFNFISYTPGKSSKELMEKFKQVFRQQYSNKFDYIINNLSINNYYETD